MKLTTILGLFLFISTMGVARSTREDLIALDTPWKKSIHDFAVKKLQHSAWGVAHAERDYLLSIELAEKDGLEIDRDVLFAAAYLHDMGGFDEFQKEGTDHAVRSAEIVEAIVLRPAGFPVAKIPAVKAVILAHTYYNPVTPTTAEETVFRDADVLDFLGVIGIARLISLVERDPVAPSLKGSVDIILKLRRTLPAKLLGTHAKKLGETRLKEMDSALASLKVESYDHRAL